MLQILHSMAQLGPVVPYCAELCSNVYTVSRNYGLSCVRLCAARLQSVHRLAQLCTVVQDCAQLVSNVCTVLHSWAELC